MFVDSFVTVAGARRLTGIVRTVYKLTLPYQPAGTPARRCVPFCPPCSCAGWSVTSCSASCGAGRRRQRTTGWTWRRSAGHRRTRPTWTRQTAPPSPGSAHAHSCTCSTRRGCKPWRCSAWAWRPSERRRTPARGCLRRTWGHGDGVDTATTNARPQYGHGTVTKRSQYGYRAVTTWLGYNTVTTRLQCGHNAVKTQSQCGRWHQIQITKNHWSRRSPSFGLGKARW